MTDGAIHYVRGDATEPQGDGPKLLLHVCNDIGAWGAGFVLALSKKWDQPEARYRDWYVRGGGNKLPLGFVQPVKVEDGLWVINMIGQRGIGVRFNEDPPIRYDAIKTCLRKVVKLARDPRYCGDTDACTIHTPFFGCGLAGGDWDVIEEIIQEILVADGLDVTVYEFDG